MGVLDRPVNGRDDLRDVGGAAGVGDLQAHRTRHRRDARELRAVGVVGLRDFLDVTAGHDAGQVRSVTEGVAPPEVVVGWGRVHRPAIPTRGRRRSGRCPCRGRGSAPRRSRSTRCRCPGRSTRWRRTCVAPDCCWTHAIECVSNRMKSSTCVFERVSVVAFAHRSSSCDGLSVVLVVVAGTTEAADVVTLLAAPAAVTPRTGVTTAVARKMQMARCVDRDFIRMGYRPPRRRIDASRRMSLIPLACRECVIVGSRR